MHYGNKAQVSLKLTMKPGQGKAINFDKTHGIIIGSKSDVTTILELVCSNATTINETAVIFSLNLEAHANITL